MFILLYTVLLLPSYIYYMYTSLTRRSVSYYLLTSLQFVFHFTSSLVGRLVAPIVLMFLLCFHSCSYSLMRSDNVTTIS